MLSKGALPTIDRMYALALLVLALSFGARFVAFPIVTSDYIYFLAKWFDALASSAWLSAFENPFANYAPLYLYLIKFLTFLPVHSLYSIKTLSVLFEIGVALAVCLVLWQCGVRSRARLLFSFAFVLALPTVVLNGALWGQSDALYALGIVSCIWCMFADRPLAAALSFALAFCFKFQAIFFAPILIGYLLRRQDTVPYLLLVPAAFAVSVVPALLGGGQFSYWMFIYAKQSAEYTGLSMSSQSIFAFTQNMALSLATQNVLFWVGLVCAAAAALAIVVLMARAGLSEQRRVLLLCCISVALLPYLLPRMHERYFYLADILTVLYALYLSRQWIIPSLVVLASTLAYLPYLSQLPVFASLPAVDLRVPSVLMLVALCVMVATFVRMPEVSKRFSNP